MRDGAHRTVRIASGPVLAWGTVIAGAWWLPVRDVIVLTGLAVAVTVAARACWSEGKARERARIAITARDEREAALVKVIARLSGTQTTGPMPRLRDVA